MKRSAYLVLTLLIAYLLSSTEQSSYEILEKSLPAVLGACLGGVLACTSIVISVLSSSSKQTKAKAKASEKFSRFVSSLEKDIKILVLCLFSAVMLPYLRSIEYPALLQAPQIYTREIKNTFFSTLEIFIAIIAFLIIFELAGILVTILRNMMSIHDTETQQSTPQK